MNVNFKVISIIISLIPIEFIALYIDYQINSMIGYIPYLVVLILVSFTIFKIGLKSSLFILISRLIGIAISWISVCLYMDIYLSSDYFKPFTTSGFSILLGFMSYITIAIIYSIIYGISSKNQ